MKSHQGMDYFDYSKQIAKVNICLFYKYTCCDINSFMIAYTSLVRFDKGKLFFVLLAASFEKANWKSNWSFGKGI